MTIMLVDDHSGFRQVVKNLLQCPGVEFVECDDGDKAVQLYPQIRPDLVLMDIEMKGLDGLRATDRIKSLFPNARIIMLTQYDDADLRLAAEQAGAAGYVLKEDLSQLQLLLIPPPATLGGPTSLRLPDNPELR